MSSSSSARSASGGGVVIDLTRSLPPTVLSDSDIDALLASAARNGGGGGVDRATTPYLQDVYAATRALCDSVAAHFAGAELVPCANTHYELRVYYAGNSVAALSSLRLAQRVQHVDWWRVDNVHVEWLPSGAGGHGTTAFVVDVWRVGAPRPVTVERMDVYARVAAGDYDRARREMFLEPDAATAVASSNSIVPPSSTKRGRMQ